MSEETEFTTKTEPKKSQSKRLRDILYLLYTRDTENNKTSFDDYYDKEMEIIIDDYKTLIK
jgi:hypothetical protein